MGEKIEQKTGYFSNQVPSLRRSHPHWCFLFICPRRRHQRRRPSLQILPDSLISRRQFNRVCFSLRSTRAGRRSSIIMLNDVHGPQRPWYPSLSPTGWRTCPRHWRPSSRLWERKLLIDIIRGRHPRTGIHWPHLCPAAKWPSGSICILIVLSGRPTESGYRSWVIRSLHHEWFRLVVLRKLIHTSSDGPRWPLPIFVRVHEVYWSFFCTTKFVLTFSNEPENEDEGDKDGESAKGNADNNTNIVRSIVGVAHRRAKAYMSIFLQTKKEL